MPDIAYSTAGFPPASPARGSGVRPVSLPRLLLGAVTIGRTPFSPPAPSPVAAFELMWRGAMVMANLDTSRLRYHRSLAYDRLDGSEKGAVSFFLGQVQAKVFAEDLFGVSRFVHVDAVMAALGRPVRGSRPDFVGYGPAGNVSLSVEVKGRTRATGTTLETRAKAQSRLLPSVVGAAATSYAHVAHCDNDGEWMARLVDPPRARAEALDRDVVTLAYYLPLVRAVRSGATRDPAGDADDTYPQVSDDGLVVARIPEASLTVALPSAVVDALSAVVDGPDGLRDPELRAAAASRLAEVLGDSRPDASPAPAERAARERATAENEARVFVDGDGVRVTLGSSWYARADVAGETRVRRA